MGSVAATAAAQGTWALSQMVVLLLLSKAGQQHVIGIFSLGLGTFAVVTLLFSFNLSAIIATDRTGSFAFSTAATARLIACLVALPAAVAAMALTGASRSELLLSTLLVATRIADHVSEIAIAFYLRESRTGSITRSYFARGAPAVALVALAWLQGWPLPAVAVATFAATVLGSVLADVLPLLAAQRRRGGVNRQPLADLLRSSRTTAAYPMLEALHVNSIRILLIILTGPAFTGMVAIAQMLFAPVQIVGTALAYPYLGEARRLHDEGSPSAISSHAWRGLVLGLLLGGVFLAACLLLPDFAVRLLFGDKAGEAGPPLLAAGLALALQPSCGFLSQFIVASHQRSSYLASPIIGLAIVWLAAGFILLVDSQSGWSHATTALVLAAVFAVSFGVRILVYLWASPTRIVGSVR